MVSAAQAAQVGVVGGAAAGRPGSSPVASRAVADRLFDDLDVSGALDVAISDGGDAARQLVRVLALS